MSGQELREILTSKGYLLKDVAEKLGLTQPNFSQFLKVQDVKSGTLENICDKLGVKMDFFYGGTRFAPQFEQRPLENSLSDEYTKEQVAYLQGQLNAIKEAYNALLGKISQVPLNNNLAKTAGM